VVCMNKLIIKNGQVYDPLNGVKGEQKDILIEEGRIVEAFRSQKDVKEIDARGKTIIPAGIDMHAHFTTPQLNWARMIGRNDSIFADAWNKLTLNSIALDYVRQGYTFILEANVFPSQVHQVIFNLNKFPILDAGFLLNVSNLWPLELEFQKGMAEEATTFLTDLLHKTKAFGFKAYNPFEAESWNFHKLRDSITEKGRLYNFSALDVYKNLIDYVERLNLAHSLHAHIEGYESEIGVQNLHLILKEVNNREPHNPSHDPFRRAQILHLAHAASYALDNASHEVINLFNASENIDFDLGFIGFDEINPYISNDRRLFDTLVKSQNPFPIFTQAVELEGDSYSTLRKFNINNEHDCAIWINALNLALKVKNKWKVQLTVNFPNYGHISNIPKIITFLLSHKARNDYILDNKSTFLRNSDLYNDESTLSFSEFIIISRSSPAKSLGISKYKGNLGVGADGDLNILNINIGDINMEKDHRDIFKAFSNIEFVIKQGKIVKKDEKVDMASRGKIWHNPGKLDITNKSMLLNRKVDFFNKFGSNFYERFKVSVDNSYLRKIE
jgi:formylmethanofuran dehydrogenase subunit A